MDQGVRYVVRIDGQTQVISTLRSMEGSAIQAEAAFTSLNNAMHMVGIGFGASMLISFGKDAVQGAADYETAVKRIKFASESLAEGGINNSFISGEADKFKIPLQNATDAYGKFLAMLSNSGIASEQVRTLHDQLLLIGKVKGLGDGQLDAAVMNLGKMLESGSLDARHFRPLEQQLSGIGAFVAKELGITVHQLAILRNKGKMTQIDPQVLLRAIEKQAASLEKFLPESVTTIQSQLNDLDNAWLRFKNDLVFSNRPELEGLFATLKDGVGFLHEHIHGIITIGKNLAVLGKVWLEYKATMFLVNGAQSIYSSFMSGYAGQAAVQVTAIRSQTAAYTELALAMERANAIQMGGIQLGAGALAASRFGYGPRIQSPASVLPVASRGAAALPVIVTLFAAEAVAQMLPNNKFTGEGFHLFGKNGIMTNQTAVGLSILEALGFDPIGDKMKDIKDIKDARLKHYNAVLEAFNMPSESQLPTPFADMGKTKKNLSGLFGFNRPDLSFGDNKRQTDKEKAAKFTPPMDKVTGQRVITYNTIIKEINGQKIDTQSVTGTKADTKSVAQEMRNIIVAIVNDSQLQAG